MLARAMPTAISSSQRPRLPPRPPRRPRRRPSVPRGSAGRRRRPSGWLVSGPSTLVMPRWCGVDPLPTRFGPRYPTSSPLLPGRRFWSAGTCRPPVSSARVRLFWSAPLSIACRAFASRARMGPSHLPWSSTLPGCLRNRSLIWSVRFPCPISPLNRRRRRWWSCRSLPSIASTKLLARCPSRWRMPAVLTVRRRPTLAPTPVRRSRRPMGWFASGRRSVLTTVGSIFVLPPTNPFSASSP
mmetsp:Transcript_27022/g.77961  ORF Transcript_27022/g.77961 Transcript_27022/m.77961 type:complete len:241 (+) Transcript_27022:208-930(+)